MLGRMRLRKMSRQVRLRLLRDGPQTHNFFAKVRHIWIICLNLFEVGRSAAGRTAACSRSRRGGIVGVGGHGCIEVRQGNLERVASMGQLLKNSLLTPRSLVEILDFSQGDGDLRSDPT